MNALGIALVWCAAQVTLVAVFAAIVYLLAYRAAPAARALAIQTSLLVCAVLAGLALSPWPRWWDAAAGRDIALPSRAASPVIANDAVTENVVTESEETPATGLPAPTEVPFAAPTIDTNQAASAFWNDLTTNLQPSRSPERTNQWSWPELVAALFLVGAGLALLRVVLGLRAVGAYRRLSDPVSDQRIMELVDVVCAELTCRRKLQVRESGELATPATTGWLRPVIFLPVEWRSWNDAQCRAVLAHEIAHIDRNDFLTSLSARVGVALHFYHPLVHWLMRRLTLEQELAADADAARVAGGQRNYLLILAEMALAQSNRPVRWPARTFLPTRGTFLRRIEMLRDSKNLSRAMSPGMRFLAVGLFVAAGIVAAGFRPSGSATGDAVANAAQPQSVAQSASKGIDLTHVPADAFLFAAVRPAEILAKPNWAGFAPLFNDTMKLQQLLGTSIANVEQFSLLQVGDRQGVPVPETEQSRANHPFGTVFIIQTIERNDFSPVIAAYGRQFVMRDAVGGKSYFVASDVNAATGMKEAYFQPNDRTIMLGQEPQIAPIVAGAASGRSALFEGANWARVKDARAAIILDGRGGPMPITGTQLESVLSTNGMIAPLFGQTQSLASRIDFNDGLLLTMFADCKDDTNVKTVKATFEALLTLGKNAIHTAASVKVAPEAQPNGMTALISLAKSLLDSAQVQQDSNLVTVRATGPDSGLLLAQATGQVPAADKGARQDANRAKSKVNLRRIGLAMHNYHEVHGHFPSAVIMGPDGKTPHSWRVALLPYLEGGQLLQQYKLDEPWDSETNKKVLAQMPDVYRHPADTSGKPVSSYYIVAGKRTVFDPMNLVRLRDITDGTSNTLLAVEAKREIPWTKPEDIPYDPDKDPPKFAGFTDGGYHVLLVDGSVRFLAAPRWEKDQLKHFIERADGHPLTIPADAGRNQRSQVAPLKSPIGLSEAEARRLESKNNLKRIGLAMHNYHEVHNHFPTAVVMGPDGKTPHSWRVALLPYLEQPELFNEYKMDEAWDSDANKKVLEKMPAVFRHPSDESNKPHSSYYVLAGIGTIFQGDKGTRIRDIKDGTVNTIMAVEAKRAVPWTKPEDIPYDHEKVPPTFGGFDRDGYNALFAEGRVRFMIPADWKKEQIKNVIEMNDRHGVIFPD